MPCDATGPHIKQTPSLSGSQAITVCENIHSLIMSQNKIRRSRATAIIPRSQCPEPQLRAFEYQDAQIEWGRRLDGDRTGRTETDGYVFEVKIRSRVYALKVVSVILKRDSVISTS